MHDLTFLQDLALVMAVSAAIMIICQRLRLPVVFGYILAGLVIGPHTPPFPLVQDLRSIHILSELGIIFLLFSIGLEFSLSKLARVGLVSIFTASFGIVIIIGAGYGLGRAFGWGAADSLFLGAILSISSTTITAKVLLEMKKVKEQFAQLILGILVIQDIIAIIIIALLSGVAAKGSMEFAEAGIAIIQVLGFVIGVLTAGFFAVPRLLKYVEKSRNEEMLVITVLGLCFGVSLIAARLGFSVALGAFLIGAVIAETPHVKDVIRKIDPIRDMFTAIFFVSVGMLLSPQTVIQYWVPILIITMMTIAAKMVSSSVGTFLSGYKPRTALMVGLGLANIGEFSFIIARLGESAGVTSDFLYPVSVSVSIITTLTTPLLMKKTPSISGFLLFITPKPLETVGRLYAGWFEQLRDMKSERKRLVFKTLQSFFLKLFIFAAGATFFFYGLSKLNAHFHFVSWDIYWLAIVAPLVIGGFFVWNGMKTIHGRIEKTIKGIFEQEGQPEQTQNDAAHDELKKLIQEEYPWEVTTEDFLLPFQECGVNVTIRDLRLRSETGATIMAIYRDDRSMPNPPPETRLLPGDVLLLMGDSSQIQAALAFFKRKIKEPARDEKKDSQPKTESFIIAEHSPLVGRTLRELKLRRKTGATILGLQKSGVAVNNPDPETVIESGDVLILFGLPEQIQGARVLLEPAK